MSSPVPAELFQSKPKQSWVRDEPFPQPFYRFDEGRGSWVEATPSATATSAPENDNTAAGDSGAVQDNTTTTTTTTTTSTQSSHLPSRFGLITWNIDALVPHAEARMAGALEYLESLCKQQQTSSETPPLVILLQEMLESDLAQIQQADWIRRNFYVTDLTTEFWESPFYGTTTLIDKRFDVQRVFRVHYGQTRMQRDALFVDVEVETTSSAQENSSSDSAGRSNSSSSDPLILRLCNTHLESLVSNPPHRPGQMKLASTFMHGTGTGTTRPDLPAPHASALAGDLNAFAPEDRTAPLQSGLRDAFLVLGGKEDTDESYTWGQQVPEETRRAFGCSRMDKILFCGGLRVDRLERIGEGITVELLPSVMVPGQRVLTSKVWVTDHLGLMAEFTIVDQAHAN
jgi:tyrosyl-DNA phosphodiesterase 2